MAWQSARSRVRRLVGGVLAVAVVGAVPLVSAVTARSASGTTAPKVSAWIPYWDQTRAYQSFLANSDLYDEAMPFWYEMQSSTSISPYSGAEDPTVISGIKGRGVRIIPTITNNFDAARVETVLSSSTNITAHVNSIVNLVTAKGYDGIDIDYENLLATDRDHFSSFVSQLASALHAKGKVLDVAVYAKTSEPGTWDGPQSESYAALGAAADRLQLMAYDYHWSTSPAGPIAPLTWVDQVAAFAASQVTPSKLELGMNLYGYDWVGSNGDGEMWDVLTARMQTNGATRNWDATDAEPWFSYTAGGASHTVWYGDSQSVGARLPAVTKYGLAGAAFWRLGGEDPAVWTTVRSAWGASATTTTSTTAPTTTSTTVGVVPSAPRSPALKNTSAGIKFTWARPASAGSSAVTSYVLYRGTASGAETPLVTVPSSTTAYVDSAVVKGVAYCYRVTAVNAAGQGPPSNEVHLKR